MTSESYAHYLAPEALNITFSKLRRVLLLGSCQMGAFPHVLERINVPFDYILATHIGAIPDQLPHPIEDYEFQIVQIAVRGLLREGGFITCTDAKQLLDDTITRLEENLDQMLCFTKQGLPTFVMNFLVPQANPMGRLLPRYDLSNPMFFFEELNKALDVMVRRVPQAYVLDCNAVAATHGRRFIQDDTLADFSHSALIGDFGFERDQLRLHPTPSPSAVFQSQSSEFTQAVFAEANAMSRTLKQTDQVKIVAVDLDDTMWRGVLAEADDFDGWETMDGWPFGFLEALSFLKKRGILLVILSKNDEEKAKTIWNKVYGHYFPLSHFAAVAINWNSKSENFAEILKAVNLLPRSAVFVDDNPVERAAMEAALPGVRTLGSDQYAFRRDLLWAPETQVALLTAETAKRTEMVQAQLVREEIRSRVSRDDFLAELKVRVSYSRVKSSSDPRSARVLELINKSNQFNTTGKRWTRVEFDNFLGADGHVIVADVEDKFTRYGLVAILMGRPGLIEQYVMSCRVVGLGVEGTVISEFLRESAAAGASEVTAQIIKTDANGPARDLWSRQGGIETSPGIWLLSAVDSHASHVLLTVA